MERSLLLNDAAVRIFATLNEPQGPTTLIFLAKYMELEKLFSWLSQELESLQELEDMGSNTNYQLQAVKSLIVDNQISFSWVEIPLFCKQGDFIKFYSHCEIPISFTMVFFIVAGITSTHPSIPHSLTSLYLAVTNTILLNSIFRRKKKVALYTFENFILITSINWHSKVKLGKSWYSDLISWWFLQGSYGNIAATVLPWEGVTIIAQV